MDNMELPDKTTLFNDRSSNFIIYVFSTYMIDVMKLVIAERIDRKLEDLLDVGWNLLFSDDKKIDNRLNNIDYIELWDKVNEGRTNDFDEKENGVLRARILKKVNLITNLANKQGMFTNPTFSQRDHFYHLGDDANDN